MDALAEVLVKNRRYCYKRLFGELVYVYLDGRWGAKSIGRWKMMRNQIDNQQFVISLSFGNYLKSDGGVDKAISEQNKMFNEANISYLQIAPIGLEISCVFLVNTMENYIL